MSVCPSVIIFVYLVKNSLEKHAFIIFNWLFSIFYFLHEIVWIYFGLFGLKNFRANV